MRETAFEESIKEERLSSFNKFKDSSSLKNRLISFMSASSPMSFFSKKDSILRI